MRRVGPDDHDRDFSRGIADPLNHEGIAAGRESVETESSVLVRYLLPSELAKPYFGCGEGILVGCICYEAVNRGGPGAITSGRVLAGHGGRLKDTRKDETDQDGRADEPRTTKTAYEPHYTHSLPVASFDATVMASATAARPLRTDVHVQEMSGLGAGRPGRRDAPFRKGVGREAGPE
jgi:hypothetical protein